MLKRMVDRVRHPVIAGSGALLAATLLLAVLSSSASAFLYTYRDGALARWTQDGTVAQEGFIQKHITAAAVAGNYIYWLNSSGSAIGRANLDGSAENDSFITLPSGSIRSDSRLAVSGSYLYWTAPSAIGRADLGAQSADATWLTLPANPAGVAVAGGHIYWDMGVDYNTAPCVSSCSWIGRANIDGTQPDNALIDAGGANQLAGMAADATHLYVAIANPT